LFRLGGEPPTAAWARVVAATGTRAVSIYGMGEIGRIGVPCGNLEAVDDVHLPVDKLGVIRRPGTGPARRRCPRTSTRPWSRARPS